MRALFFWLIVIGVGQVVPQVWYVAGPILFVKICLWLGRHSPEVQADLAWSRWTDKQNK